MITDEEIRPGELMKKRESSLSWDIDFLKRRQKDFIKACCPACESDQSNSIFTKYGMNYEECHECSTVYISPRPPESLLHEFYEQSQNYDFWNKYIFPQSEDIRRVGIFQPRVKKMLGYREKYHPSASSLVDVGAGFGTFCEEVIKTNKLERVIAVEPTPSLAKTCHEKGIETLQLPVESLSSTLKIDIITSFEVIEHLFSPKDFITTCRDHLNVNGLLILSCPNIKGFDIKCLGPKHHSIDHEHLNYFHPKSLNLLLNSSGFEVLKVETPGELDAELVRKGILNGDISLDNNIFLKEVLIDNWETQGGKFQEFLTATRQSSHMIAIARKK